MKSQRFFIFLVLLGVSLHASAQKSYPLRIEVQKVSYGCTNCSASYPLSLDPPVRDSVEQRYTSSSVSRSEGEGPPSGPNRLFGGNGTGLIFYTDKTFQAFSFTYKDCMAPLPLSDKPLIVAKWKKTGLIVDALVPPYEPNKLVNFAAKRLVSCQLQVTLSGSVLSKK